MDNTLVRIDHQDAVKPTIILGDTEERTFITANTVNVTQLEMREQHIIPVFVKDNEPVISHHEFIQITQQVVADNYYSEQVGNPVIRVSHPIKGRIPEAKDKPANQLQDFEKTVYYERMMFMIEIPSIQDTIEGNQLSLVIGGVKAYNEDNLYSRSVSDQHFKVFVGFKNKVCTNLCVWTDGLMGDLKVKTAGQLTACITTLIRNYNEGFHLFNLKQLCNYSITEHQFAQLVGRCRMYNHLPYDIKKDIPALMFGDTQLGLICRDYYKDESFCRNPDGTINLWKLYNLFTNANKSTYIDSFLDRSVNAYNFVEQVRYGLEDKNSCWYLG